MSAGYALDLSIYQPFHNWDAIGYIAAAKSFEQHDFDSAHSFTNAELRKVLPAAQSEDLSRGIAPGTGRGGVYRHAVNTDSSASKEQLQKQDCVDQKYYRSPDSDLIFAAVEYSALY